MSVFNKSGEILAAPYDINGDVLSQVYDVNSTPLLSGVDYNHYTKSNYCEVSLSQMQGFDIYNGIIFQFRANSSNVNNVMCTIDTETSTIIQNNIQATSDHGDSASFSNEKYDESDDYPLLYVTADTTPCKVYINRVTQTSSTLVNTLFFPTEKAGYYAAAALDNENDKIYIIGYTEQNYQTDNGGSNKTLISKWDLSNLTDNGDDTYTPEFIESFERPFIYVMQGQQFHDNMLWISSGYIGSSESYIYAISPIDGALIFTIDLETTTEVEGLAFISDTEMVVGFAGGTYEKYTFLTIN